MLLTLHRAVWSYRGFILGSVKREFQARYRNSLFGALWTVLNPLSMILVYTVIFSHIMRARLPGVEDGMAYSVYLCAGLLTWGFFAEITTRSQGMFLENANLLKKISFPRICLPLIVLLNAGINFVIILGLFLGFLLVTGRWPGMALLALVPLLVLQMIFAAGLGLVSNKIVIDYIGQPIAPFIKTDNDLLLWPKLSPLLYPKFISSWVALLISYLACTLSQLRHVCSNYFCFKNIMSSLDSFEKIDASIICYPMTPEK